MNTRKKIIIHENIPSQFEFNAGSKARNDIESVIKGLGYDVFTIYDTETSDRENLSFLSKFKSHIKVYRSWISQIKKLPDNSAVIIQFPIFFHTFFFNHIIHRMHKKGCFVIAIIHDLETLRLVNSSDRNKRFFIKRSILEEKRTIQYFDMLIVHNNFMKEKVISLFSINKNKIRSIDIFDYLIPDYQKRKKPIINCTYQTYPIIIAGNLDFDKSEYIYKLPSGCKFELYGPNYTGLQTNDIHYNGAYLPDELPFYLNGGFGLVWDGQESYTCCGPTGDYLRYNNPHKTSLYLACGIPVIIWKEAALAQFVIQNNCGITVDSLNELIDVVHSITPDVYNTMKNNAKTISKKLRNGYFTTRVFKSLL